MNKINLIGGDLIKVLELKNRLSKKAVAVTLPIGRETELHGYIDLIKMKAYEYKDVNSPDLLEIEIPQELKETVNKHREVLVEALAEQDDDLMRNILQEKN
jgi:elongation factor G